MIFTLKEKEMKPPHVLLPSACSQTETFDSVGSIRSVRFVGTTPTSHLKVVMLALGIIRCLVRTYPRRHPEPPHIPAAFHAITDGDVVPMSPKYSPDTHQIPQNSQKRQTPTSRHRKHFFGGFFLFAKANGKSLSRTKQNKKPDPESNKNKMRATEGGRKRKPIEKGSEDSECRPRASKEARLIDKQEHKRSIRCWDKPWEEGPQNKQDSAKAEEAGGRERANLDVGLNHTYMSLWR